MGTKKQLLSAKESASQILFSKKIAPLVEKIAHLRAMIYDLNFKFSYESDQGLRIVFLSSLNGDVLELIKDLAYLLKPWRKGPFYLEKLFIDAEWKSFIKWNLIASHIKLEGKDVVDVGCNNGYYLFEMAKFSPKSLTGFDPSGLYKCQFDFINLFIQEPIVYELLGIEHLKIYQKKFDIIFCLGVLYHRSDPIVALKSLKMGLKDNGEVILDTLIIDSDQEIALCPSKTYAKMPNVYFIPTIPTLKGWAARSGLEVTEILAIKDTTIFEQRKTEWIGGLSLESFLNSHNSKETIEGYLAPRRGYFKLKKCKG